MRQGAVRDRPHDFGLHDDVGVLGRAVRPDAAERERFPFGIAPNVDIGIIFVFAVTSLAVYGIILGGWSSNNKYSALGEPAVEHQVVSYEVPLGLSVLGVGLLAGSFNLDTVIGSQTVDAGIRGLFDWYIWCQPLACLIFFTSALAESNRLPFDLPECEQELVGGYHTEYSALKFAMFFLAEYTHMITVSFLTAILFFGGWHFPWIAEAQSAIRSRRGQGACPVGKGGRDHLVHHAHPLDDAAVPLRSVDEPELESLHSAVSVQPAGNDDRKTVRSVAVVDAAVLDRVGRGGDGNFAVLRASGRRSPGRTCTPDLR